jgi:hypothetical protein
VCFDATDTFEVLNSRGLLVSALDRLKSKLMGIAFELAIPNKVAVIDELHRVGATFIELSAFDKG